VQSANASAESSVIAWRSQRRMGFIKRSCTGGVAAVIVKQIPPR